MILILPLTESFQCFEKSFGIKTGPVRRVTDDRQCELVPLSLAGSIQWRDGWRQSFLPINHLISPSQP